MLNKLKQDAFKKIEEAKTLKEMEAFYRQYLGRKGELSRFLRSLGDFPEKERKEKGKLANQIKEELSKLIEKKKKEFQTSGFKVQSEDKLDITAPGLKLPQGHLHPMTLVQRKVEEIFQGMGFLVADGPEIETEYYNFNALNIPQNHPARDLWDTFWLKDAPLLLRTHTSPVQVRYMEKHSPALRIIVPGRCFRHEATDTTHEAVFHQVEGLMVDKDVSVGNFKAVIEGFLKQFFGPDTKMRLRPSYFPFVEPGFEIDIKRKQGDWLELMGAGMVHPNVFKSVGYKANRWQGFAFGFGLERLTMIKYGIDNIRLFFDNDLRFLKQF